EVLEPDGGRFLNDALHQAIAETLPLETVDGVEPDDLPRALGGIRSGEQPRDAGEMPAADRHTESRAEQLGHLVGRPNLQHTFPLSPPEEPPCLLDLAERERTHTRVVAFREQRPGPCVAEQLVGNPVRRAQVHLLDAGLETLAYDHEEWPAVAEPAPLRLPLLQDGLE